MNPNLFLKTFWRMDIRPQVFVAMSFADVYEQRYKEVIAPAIESIQVAGIKLKPCRVDLSKTGDSVLTDIIDGIAHAEMFLADVSSLGCDSKTGEPYRNGNVMYEVGLALACRQATEILLIRDDRDKFLFDVSTIPHAYIDFTKVNKARSDLMNHLLARLKERNHINDARVKLALATLSSAEKHVLEDFAKFPADAGFGWEKDSAFKLIVMSALPRLLDKQLIQAFAAGDDGQPVYRWTRLGYVVAQGLKTGLPRVSWEREVAEVTAVDEQKEIEATENT